MRTRITICLAILLQSFSVGFIPAQSTFDFVLEYPVRKYSPVAIERDNGEIVAVINERSGTEYAMSSPTKGYLLSFSAAGDTITHRFSFGDSLFSFNVIQELTDGGFLLAGQAYAADSESLNLMLVKLDNNLNKVWTRYYDMSAYYSLDVRKIFQLNGQYLFVLDVCVFPCTRVIYKLVWFDSLGNMGNNYTHFVEGRGQSDWILNIDSTQLWAFTPGLAGGTGQRIRLEFDTAQQFIGQTALPFVSGSGNYYNVIWHTDSTFIYSCEYDRPNPASSNDQDMWLISFDSSLNIIDSSHFGSYNTKDKASVFRDVAFRNPDSIYFVGFKDQYFGKPPVGRVNWIMAGQTDARLEPRYLHFIGGDHYYESYYVVATRDGGSFICASRFNHDTQVYDPVFLKLNNLGLLTANRAQHIELKKTAFWPVPCTDLINFHSAEQNMLLRLYDMAGKLALEKRLPDTKGIVLTNHLPEGVYLYELHYKNGAVEKGKIVKSY